MTAMDDSRSATLQEEKSTSLPSMDREKSVLPSRASINEKEAEADVTTSPRLSVHENAESEKEDGHDLSQIKTSESGMEYPQGLKLGLITLALCLSVFLMALVRVRKTSRKLLG